MRGPPADGVVRETRFTPSEVQMSEDENIETVKKCYEKFGEGDIPGVIGFLDPDIDLTVPEVENAPHGGIWHGPEAVGRFFDLLQAAEEITDFEVLEFIAQGDRVVVRGRCTATVRATGRYYSTEWVHLHTVQKGLITSFVEYFDTAATLRAFQKVTRALT